ncbi:DinB family protein [Virgibacillus ndiopensis]|uniref:DinB family protein n=1 Tax=Virgibacillus ndiopensis TaxID=2004408 RepID=UPI000C084EA7
MDVLARQYDWIRQTRELLFQFCEVMTLEDYTKDIDSFGGDSIRDIHVHVAECYQHWLGNIAMKKGINPVKPDSINSVADLRHVFKETDRLVEAFLQEYEGRWDLTISRTVSWQEKPIEYTTLWLFTHTITHEFHHKGQIVKMGRLLGYIPPDTDLIERWTAFSDHWSPKVISEMNSDLTAENNVWI